MPTSSPPITDSSSIRQLQMSHYSDTHTIGILVVTKSRKASAASLSLLTRGRGVHTFANMPGGLLFMADESWMDEISERSGQAVGVCDQNVCVLSPIECC